MISIQSDTAVTNAQFTEMLIKNRYGVIEPIDGHWYSGYMTYALKKGIITDSEYEFPDAAITRQSAARVVHQMLIKAYNEQDDENWTAAEALADLYDCHTCVMHIAQVYVKGIMTGCGDGLFRGSDALTHAQAEEIIMRLAEPSLRTPAERRTDSNSLITAELACELIKNGAVLLDVRPADDYAAGRIRGSVSVPMESILSNPRAAFERIGYDDTIIVYCRRGTQSRRAAMILDEAGYKSVYDLGGVENGEYELIAE